MLLVLVRNTFYEKPHTQLYTMFEGCEEHTHTHTRQGVNHCYYRYLSNTYTIQKAEGLSLEEF